MRGRALVAVGVAVVVFSTTSEVRAQRSSEASTSLPGIGEVALADSFHRFAAAALSLGYGYLGGVLNDNGNDGHHRAASSIAASIRPLPNLAVSFRYDNRYDKHVDLEAGDGSDDGWLAETRLALRYVTELVPAFRVGAETTVRFPPDGEPPSFSVSGVSIDLVGLATYRPTPQLAIAANAGFRVDRSADSIDNADMLSPADRLALGVSDYNSVITGVGATYDAGPLSYLGEAAWDILVGSDSPGLSRSPLRLSAGVRYRASDAIQLQLIAQASPSDVGDFAPATGLYPVTPSFATIFTLSYSHPLANKPTAPDCAVHPDDPRCGVVDTKPTKDPEPAKLAGAITDESGAPLADAKVTLTIERDAASGGPIVVTVATDKDGKFELKRAQGSPLGSGKGTITVDAEGFERKTVPVTLTAGQLTNVSVPMQERLPLGQLRGVVQSYGGKPVRATISVEPGGKTATAADDGSFELDLEPGEYRIRITATGYEEQTGTVSILRNGVTIKNVDMRAAK